MRLRNYLLCSILIFTVACTNEKEKLNQSIEKIKAVIEKSDDLRKSREKVDELTKLYVSYAEKYKGDSISGFYLFEAAKLQMNLGNGKEAIKYCDKLMTDYKDNAQIVSSALFTKGFILDDIMHSTEAAKKTYEELYTKFPQSELAEQARQAWQTVGLSAEEILKKLQDSIAASDVPVEIVN